MREIEVAAYLRSDDDLVALAPGGIYAASVLGVEGITDPINTPSVWAGGFQATIQVRQGADIPSGLLVDFKTKATHNNQRVSIYAYALEAETVDTILKVVYGLMMGHKFDGAWGAIPIGGLSDIRDAPELPPGTKVGSKDYQIGSVQYPVLAE